MPAAGTTTAESQAEQWESRFPPVRAPRPDGRRRIISWLHLLRNTAVTAYASCLASFPDHHLSKSGTPRARKTTNAPPGTRRRWGVWNRSRIRKQLVALYGVRLPESGPAPNILDSGRSPSAIQLVAPSSLPSSEMPLYSRASHPMRFARRSARCAMLLS